MLSGNPNCVLLPQAKVLSLMNLLQGLLKGKNGTRIRCFSFLSESREVVGGVC